MDKIITVPFGWLLGQLYSLTGSYGLAMIIFAVIVQSIMLPIRAKSKKNSMKLSRIQPRIQDIQKRYTDPQKQNEMMQKLYQEEGVSLGGSCLWSLVPLLILFPLFSVIRQPITYMLGESAEVAQQIVDVVKANNASLFNPKYPTYDQVFAAQGIAMYAKEIQAAIPGISAETLAGINFEFLGVNLGNVPTWQFWAWDAYNWANIGLFLIPVISAASQLLQMWIGQKMNDSVITNEKGVQDKETAAKSQQNQSMQMMMWMMPIMSLMIGFSVSAGLSIYWFVGGVYSMISDAIMTKYYRKVYDAEDAVRLAKAMEQDRIEAEKERIRAERRAANPDGQTQNTSKKKLNKKLREEEAAAKAAAAKEYNAKKGIVETAEEKTVMSGIPSRPYCKGRNYDPNRYASKSTEE